MKAQMFGNVSCPGVMVEYLVRTHQSRVCTSWAYIFSSVWFVNILQKTCNDNRKTCQTLENVICSKGTCRKYGRGASSKSLHLFGLHLFQVLPRGLELLLKGLELLPKDLEHPRARTSDHRTCCQNLSQYRLWKHLESRDCAWGTIFGMFPWFIRWMYRWPNR